MNSATDNLMTETEKAVAQLRAYAKHMYDNAEAIIGSIDEPNCIRESGMRFSFTLLEHDEPPVLSVETDYIVLDALDWRRGAR